MTTPWSPRVSFPSMIGSPMGSSLPTSSDGSVVLSGSINWEPVRKRLLGPDLNDALSAATELREGIEIVHTFEFPLLLSALLPAFSTILAHRTSPSPDTSTVEHKLRNVVLEIISRMPTNEILRPHAPHLVAVALDILNRDYEENALLASRIIFDLYKVYRSLPQDHVQPYLDFVQKAYKSLPTSVQRNFLYSALAEGPPLDQRTVSGNVPSTTLSTTPSVKGQNEPAISASSPAGVSGATAVSAVAQGSSETPATTIAPAQATGDVPGESAAENMGIGMTSGAKPTTPQAPTSKPEVGGASAAASPAVNPAVLSSKSTPTATTSPPDSTTNPSMEKLPSSPVPPLSPKSTSSFRVLTECPLVVMLMFQLYPKFLRSNIPSMINVMMEALALRAPPVNSIAQGNQTLDTNAKRLYLSRCRDLVAAQAKTLSFLTYLLRGFSSDLKPYEDRLASNVVALMSTCPREFISTRKELLVATRHLLNSEFRNGFFRHVDALLDERVLMGSHHRYSEQTILRPLGYTTLSDLVHHVRSQMNLNQISKVVSIFSRVLHDSSKTLPLSTQYTAVRTLLNVVDIAYNNGDRNPQVGRDILVRVLSTLVDKLSALHTCHQMTLNKGNIPSSKDKAPGDTDFSLLAHLDIPLGSDPRESLRDLKSMIRAIIVGIKTLIWYINSYRTQRDKDKVDSSPPASGTNEEVASAMLKITNSEQAIIDKYILLSFPCMKWLKEEPASTNGTSGDRPQSDQFRDVLTYFAAAFTTLDGYDLRRTLGRRLECIVDAIADEPTAIVVPRHLLAANATTSFEFCTILMNFLVERMEALSMAHHDMILFIPPTPSCDSNEIQRMMSLCKNGHEDVEVARARSTAFLHLFERVLKSLSTFPDNERALRPHLRRIVSTCLRASMEKAEFKMDNNCMLLRYVFRSISAGKFEESYRELLPLIPTVLNGLFRVFQATDDVILQHTIIELLLTIPARLSSLLPHMNLLLRVIVAALESTSGDLVNLGLRTLEFWVDNLNPEFLFPELSKQTELFVQLMKALSSHLMPAPYPYGLLTLRLLGKLGGKNRRVLRDPMDIKDSYIFECQDQDLRFHCHWSKPNLDREALLDPSANDYLGSHAPRNNFTLPIPVERCVAILRRLIAYPELSTGETGKVLNTYPDMPVKWTDSAKLWDLEIEKADFLPYCIDVVNETSRAQAEAALSVLQTALAKIYSDSFAVFGDNGDHEEGKTHYDDASLNTDLDCRDDNLRLVGVGLLLGAAIESVRQEAIPFAKGFISNIYLTVQRHQQYFLRIDANGSCLTPRGSERSGGTDMVESGRSEESNMFGEELGSLKPFGYFELTGPLLRAPNPLVVGKMFADLLSQTSSQARETGLDLLRYIITLSRCENVATEAQTEKFPYGLDRGALIFFECLLSAFCEECIASLWNRREGLYQGIILLLESLGVEWSRKYETEIMHVALFSLKSVPREMAMAAVQSFDFVVRCCTALYGKIEESEGPIVTDVLMQMPSPKDDKTAPNTTRNDDQTNNAKSSDPSSNPNEVFSPCEEVLQVLMTELASTKHMLRLASRYILKHYVIKLLPQETCNNLFRGQLALIKRVLFSRSLRLLPLPEQVGAVEALAMIVEYHPNLIPLNDQHLLAFLSELLKMSSVADGEMTDPNLMGSVVDKNGYAIPAHQSQMSAGESNSDAKDGPSSSLFLRRDCILTVDHLRIHIPQELPNGVQLRVSSICLLRAVIEGHSNQFFDAEGSTPVGNIRPHVISLLFRSLVSNPVKAVIAAHHALRDVLTLSVITENGKSKSRLRKELLQTCIRPVLLNLRDYSKLSVQLLRGLSRLLSLLSSWFNKTLGEKMLDHLQKWTDPTRMKSQKIWNEGEEPDVAAAVIELFVLLPHASHFVEPLVKTTIKLEACLPAFKSRYVTSPYRLPLARYLNKHCQYTVSFFLQRIKTPMYSNLFQDLVRLPESKALRDYLNGPQCSVSLLNICFERPLAIIRSEKTATSSPSPTVPQLSGPLNPKDLLNLHGIHPFSASPTQREIWLKQDVDGKKKKLQILQQEVVRTKDMLQAKASASSPASTIAEIEDAKRKHKNAKAAYDRGAKEFAESKQRYTSELAQARAAQKLPQEMGGTRPMTIEGFELQLQGFRLVETLILHNKEYMKDHNDVLRAFRWLWRSKGRYLRLQHEDAVPPRYHEESKLLATNLVDYSRNFPNDVDLLFELIRIFLQPSPTDFSFVRSYLGEAVSTLSLDQKRQIIQRFFTLLAGESTEEIKTLSTQLVVYPMLHSSFKPASVDQHAPSDHNTLVADIASKPKSLGDYAFIDSDTTRLFVTEVLFKDGKQIHCDDRLKVELLKICNLLLEFVPHHVGGFGQEIFKFCWSLLKSEDVSCKSWAYLVLCRHIVTIGTPAKVILQVYGSLIRSHQPEGKEITRSALNLLVPAMRQKLGDQENRKAIEYTNRVMFEEVNSIPQLAHIWQTIVNHPPTFSSNKNQFVRYMINSLTRLGLPPNSPPENRSLSIAVIELILQWNQEQRSVVDEPYESKQPGHEKPFHGGDGEHHEKRRKTSSGVLTVPTQPSDFQPLLDQTMVDTMINFLVRLRILLADPKLDNGSCVDYKVTLLLRSIASEWKESNIRTVYLDKVVSLCREYNKSIDGHHVESKLKHKTNSKSKNSTNPSPPTGNKSEDGRHLTSSLLSACLDILSTLSDVSPHNPFLVDNASQLNEILTSCFQFAQHRSEKDIREKLSTFVIRILSLKTSRVDKKVVLTLKTLLEGFLRKAEVEYKKVATANPPSPEPGRQNTTRSNTTSLDVDIDEGVALFALDVIKKVGAAKPLFYRSFATSLLSLLTSIVKNHAAAAATKQKQGGVSYLPQAGTCNIRQMYHTPISGILAEMCLSNHSQGFAGTGELKTISSYPSKELKEFDSSLCTAVIILDVFGSSDIAYSFSQNRKTLFHALSTILDSSNSMQLLLAAVRVIGKWLSDDSGRPLTLKERNGFLWKIASFDFNGIPDVVAQPLSEIVAQFVICLLKRQQEICKSALLSKEKAADHRASQRVLDSDELIIGRSLSACLLTANHELRDKLLSYYISQSHRVAGVSILPEVVHIERIPQQPAEVLWQLFHTDFEGLGGRDWVVVFVELLLCHVCPLVHKNVNPTNESSKEISSSLQRLRSGHSASLGIVKEHTYFCEKLDAKKDDISCGGHELRTSLRRLVHADSRLCRGLLESLLSAAWKAVPFDEVRLKLAHAMESLLSRSFHSQFLKPGIMEEGLRSTNVLKSFLKSAALLEPLPYLDVDMLVSLAESYNSWYEVLAILEELFMVLSDAKLSESGDHRRKKVLLAMRHCYRKLGEENIWTSLALISCDLEQTHRAASLASHGKIDEALDAYTSLAELVDADTGIAPSEFEANVIEEQWVELNREQCQTAVVAEYAVASNNSALMLESAWKERNWDRVRALCSSPAIVAAVEAGEPSVKLCETLLAVADGKVSDVENLHAQTAQLCLFKWQLLPEFSSASSAHASLLHFFHRLVEIRESGQIMVETRNHTGGKTLPDLKNLLNAWRYRLPNDYEQLSMWDEVFTWRSHMFKAITSNFSWSEPSTLATLHDRPWTTIRMAMTARKHGMRQTALLLLNKLTDSRAMDVTDAYLKLREQILAYNNPENELERTGGLNLINTTNLSFFDATQKSELFRLKAIFLSSLRRTSKSNQAYCHAVQISPTHAKAWVSWGGLCSSLGTLTEKQAEVSLGKDGSQDHSKDARSASAKKVAQYLAQAMGCYLEAVLIDASSEKSRIHLPKCLWILSKDGSSAGVLCQTIEGRGTKLPPWVWLPWIPQLLTGLCRVEGRAIKAILTRVVKAYPQAVYYSLRAFYLERRDVERAKGVPSTATQHMPSVAYAEEMMSTLRRSHASLWSSLEAILEELIVKFRPSYEEELLATISALLERAESHIEKQYQPDKTKTEDEEAMVASWSKTLSRIAAKFFRESDVAISSSRRDERVKKTADFKHKYKVEFESDFKVSASEGLEPSSPESEPKFKLEGYITRLQKWKSKLEAEVSRTPKSLPLVESSPSLAMFAGDTPDLWPGACDTKYLSVGNEQHQEDDDEGSRNQPTTSSSAAIARKAAMTAAMAAARAAAREGVGGEYGGGAASIEIPGQYSPNSSSSADIKPSPELHAKLVRFEPNVEVLRRNDQLVRRVGMLGSDGRTYRFLLQFAIPYWTRADERTAQTHFIIDKFLRQNPVCARNHLSVQPTAAIPVAQRLRMTLDTESRISLDDVFRASCEKSNMKMETIPNLFLKEVSDKLNSRTTPETSEEDREKLEKSIRRETYDSICESRVDKSILLRHLQRNLSDPESLFHFRRVFAGQLASNSLLQYTFSVAERTPQRIVFLQRNAQVLSPDFRVSYSNQGFIVAQTIPFRMTPNIATLIGKSYLEGRYIRSLAMVADAIRENREEFDPILRLLMRDDILAWYSKSLAKTDSKTQELERQLVERVSKNVSMLHSRFSECAPRSTQASKEGPVDLRVRELYEAATGADRLSLMPTNYHPWL